MNRSKEERHQTSGESHLSPFMLGIFVACFTGALNMWATKLLMQSNGIGLFITSQFVLIPLTMGLVASFFWRKLHLTVGRAAFGCLGITFLGLLGSALFMQEGIICLIIAAPLLFLFVWLGAVLGDILWRRSRRLQVSLLPLIAAMLVADTQTPHHHSSVVVDEITIRATPAQVWHYIPSFPPIETPPDYWLWKIGLPVPVQSTVESPSVGAARDCRFTGGLRFEEKIVALEKQKLLIFDITKQPDHPEINGHFNLDRGSFELRDNGDGTTTLIGSSWYRLHVYPTQYFDYWAQEIIRRVHLRVMNHIKELAERDARNHHRILNKTNPNTT